MYLVMIANCNLVRQSDGSWVVSRVNRLHRDVSREFPKSMARETVSAPDRRLGSITTFAGDGRCLYSAVRTLEKQRRLRLRSYKALACGHPPGMRVGKEIAKRRIDRWTRMSREVTEPRCVLQLSSTRRQSVGRQSR